MKRHYRKLNVDRSNKAQKDRLATAVAAQCDPCFNTRPAICAQGGEVTAVVPERIGVPVGGSHPGASPAS